MKIALKVDVDCVDRILGTIPKNCAAFLILNQSRGADGANDLVEVVCENNDAEIIYNTVRVFCPEIAPEIRKAIYRSRPSLV